MDVLNEASYIPFWKYSYPVKSFSIMEFQIGKKKKPRTKKKQEHKITGVQFTNNSGG